MAHVARSITLALLFGLSASAYGCAVESASVEGEEASTTAIVDVDQSTVKRQSIGNCWLYATVGWAESLNKSATGTTLNISESYSTYWHWFEQIANDGTEDEISTGGHFSTAVDLFSRYGVMTEKTFIASEATAEMSLRQKSALDAMNASLKTGALSTRAARRDRALVRRELNKAWGLTASVVAKLDKVFGASVTRTVDKSTVSLTRTSIVRTTDIPVAFKKEGATVTTTLADVIGTKSSEYATRKGTFAWTNVSYPRGVDRQRAFLQRVQRALHDRQPVVMSWFVDFNSLNDKGQFAEPPATPGHQGGHMVVMEDYQINDVPGFGTLQAGVAETRPEALSAALDVNAKIEFIRVKNSWGSERVDRQFVIPGHHDLYMKYLNGPVKRCTEKADGSPDVNSCVDTVPFTAVVLPAGY